MQKSKYIYLKSKIVNPFFNFFKWKKGLIEREK